MLTYNFYDIVNFEFKVIEGRRYTVRRINISGNNNTLDKVIRREMRQFESSWYSEKNIRRSKERIEKLGFFNPLMPKEKKERVGLQSERIKYWLSQGAKPTTRVARLLGENNLMEMPKPGNNPNKAIPKKDRKKDASEAPKEEKKADAPKEEKKADAPKEEKKAEAPKEEKKK